MIAYLQRLQNTAGLLAHQLGAGNGDQRVVPRLIDGDCHGVPLGMLARHDAVRYLAEALNGPVERLGQRAPDRPVWFCSVQADPRHPDLSDAGWSAVARRLLAATGVAPPGDPDACRWIALRNDGHRLVVVATRAREDGGIHDPGRDAFRLQRECQRIAVALGHLPTARRPLPQENHVPPAHLRVIITLQPTGSVSANGAFDDLSSDLLKHAGFQQIQDWRGRRHRLPTSTPLADRAAIATRAAQMLRAARYEVELDPALDAEGPSTANPLSPAHPESLPVSRAGVGDRWRARAGRGREAGA